MNKPVDKNHIKSIEENHYYLFHQDFTNESTANAIRFILERNLMTDPPACMKMIINSPGGDVTSAFAMIDTIKGSRVPIYTYGLGQISSCGLLAFISGQKGHRYITKNTAILSHQYSWGSYGKQHELMSKVKEFENTSERILEHYKKCTGLSEKKIKEYLLPSNDVWLTAKEAVNLGIADEIVSFY